LNYAPKKWETHFHKNCFY